MQRASYEELRERRAAAVQAVSEVGSLEFVNAGGTGELERVASEPAMTEATAGSGFYAPTLGWDALTAVAKQIDTPQQRAHLADALVRLRDQRRINRRQAAYALLDLDCHSTRFIGASLLEAVAVSIGVSRTPGGLHIAA